MQPSEGRTVPPRGGRESLSTVVGDCLTEVAADPTALQGTEAGNRILGCTASNGGMFALGVIVRAGEDDAFCVSVPTDDGTELPSSHSACTIRTICLVKVVGKSRIQA